MTTKCSKCKSFRSPGQPCKRCGDPAPEMVRCNHADKCKGFCPNAKLPHRKTVGCGGSVCPHTGWQVECIPVSTPENAPPAPPEPPPGFRLATDEDKQGKKPNGCVYYGLYYSEWYIADQERIWGEHKHYAVPLTPIPDGWRPVLPEEQAKTKKPGCAKHACRGQGWQQVVRCGLWDQWGKTPYIVPDGTVLEPIDAPANSGIILPSAPAECAECAKLRAEMRHYVALSNDEKANCTTLEIEIAELRQQINDYRSGQEALRLDLERVRREREKARAERERVCKERDNEKAHVATWESTATALLERAEKAEKARDAARADAETAVADRDQVIDDLQTKKGEALLLDKQLREARAELARERDAHRALVRLVNGKEA